MPIFDSDGSTSRWPQYGEQEIAGSEKGGSRLRSAIYSGAASGCEPRELFRASSLREAHECEPPIPQPVRRSS